MRGWYEGLVMITHHGPVSAAILQTHSVDTHSVAHPVSKNKWDGEL